MHFLIYSGSARQGNFTQHVAELVAKVTNQRTGITTEIISPQSLGIDFNDEGEQACPPALKEKVIAADGFILIAPEYNHSYSASLKYMLDLNLKAYIHKPVALVGVSKGPWGGTRVIESLLHPVREMGMAVTFTDVNFTHIQEEIQNGVFVNEANWVKRIDRMLEELIWMATTLKYGRDNVASQYHKK
jgi:NAD(P)H-dependent FMN reductase